MLPKAVLTLVGQFVGIAALMASPLIARAAPPSTDPHAKDRDAKEHDAKGHDAKESVKGRDAKEVAKDHDAKESAKGRARARSAKKGRGREAVSANESKTSTRIVVSEKTHDGEPSPQVVIEQTTTKRAPKASATPLPTIAAASVKPLLFPDDVKHAAEPTRTPVVLTTRPRKALKTTCLHAPIDVTRGGESESFALTKCDGSVAPLAIEEMSILTRPGGAAKPATPIADLAKKTGDELAPGIKRMDARVLERMQLVVDHFAGDGKAPKLFVVSGYRPTSKGSFHASGRAIDFRMEGVENTDLVTFCKTLPDTGCGFYPNSAFIHLDVRDAGAGHVSWIDASEGGDKPKYVATWPAHPKAADDQEAVRLLAHLDELQLLPPTPEAPDSAEREDVKPPAKPAPASLTKKMIELDER